MGERTEGGPIALGPLTLQGPTVGLGGFGFADGKVLVSVIVGVQRASLAFGGSPTTGATSAAQTNSGITVDLIGVMGSFELAVDVFGLLGGNVDVRLTGKWSLQVASLDAQIPNVARLQATGIKVTYDPKGAADQEIVKVNTATITFPSFGITGSIRPYDPATSSNIPKNNDRGSRRRGDSRASRSTATASGSARPNSPTAWRRRPPGSVPDPNALTPTAPDKKITFGGILELDDIRIGISGLDVRFPADGAAATDTAGFTGRDLHRHGRREALPGQGLRRDAHRPPDRRRQAARTARSTTRRSASRSRSPTARWMPSSSRSTRSRSASAPTSPSPRATSASTPGPPAPTSWCSSVRSARR